jgi:Icc-related predicted phosphoesterase
VRLFYVTDVHGSDRCFTKFVNAGAFYRADALLLGGDITGKAIVLFRRAPEGGYAVRFMGRDVRVAEGDEADELERRVANMGYYPHRCDEGEAAALAADAGGQSRLFLRLIVERVERWVGLAAERLRPLGIPCLVNAGNDDPPEIDAVLREADHIEFLEGRVVELPDGTEVASCGYANRTPWNCPRDIDEPDLERRLRAVAEQVREPARAIFNFHCPPYDTGIDQGPRLDGDLRMQQGLGGIEMHPVGSTACRRVIEEYQPLLALHGHLHESRGTHRLGRTLCLNPGSEYTEGILRGALIDLEGRKVRNHVLTTG